MKLMNNIAGEYQALPEEMLSKPQVLFIQFKDLLNSEMTDFPLVKSLPFYLPKAWKDTPFGRSLTV